MYDAMGHALSIGDHVKYKQPNYHGMIWGTIVDMTSKTVLIKRDGYDVQWNDNKRPHDVFLDTRGWTKPV